MRPASEGGVTRLMKRKPERESGSCRGTPQGRCRSVGLASAVGVLSLMLVLVTAPAAVGCGSGDESLEGGGK